MRAEHLKGWLQGMKKEEESEGANTTAGDRWRPLTKLVQTVWDEGCIPPQLGWIITVLVPKGRGVYCGIGLLEPIWKVIERVMDQRLKAIDLHDSLYGCSNQRGMGTTVIEAKLTQQLTHIEQTPFYGVFVDLTKAFDAMDRDQCLQLLGEYGAGPKMRRLVKDPGNDMHAWEDSRSAAVGVVSVDADGTCHRFGMGSTRRDLQRVRETNAAQFSWLPPGRRPQHLPAGSGGRGAP